MSFKINFLYSGTKLNDIPFSKTPEFVLVGRSNVGKSSLLNALANQKKLAYVSQTPGRTQTINLFSGQILNKEKKDQNSSKTDKNEPDFYLADLPGYGFAQSSKHVSHAWADSLQEYFERRKNIRCVIFLIDIRRDILQEDKDLVFWFKSLGLPVLVVQTKCDKSSKNEITQQTQKHAAHLMIHQDDIISVSVHKKIGIQTLCNQLINMVNHS
jgi:GTP-binding protein